MAETARVLPLVRAEEGGHRANVLGPFRLSRPGGADRTPRARKSRALLAYLLLTPGPVSRERLAALFWGDRGEDQAKASLRQALYELRELSSGPDPLLIVRRDEVSVRPGACSLDVERMTAAARTGDIGQVSATLDNGDLTLLADLDGAGRDFDDWLSVQRTRWRDRLATAAVDAGEAALAAGRPVAEVRRLADALERADPLSEPAVRLGLRADRAAGDLAALHRRYRRFAEQLSRELDAEPAGETQALLQVEAAPPPPTGKDAPTASPAPPAARRRRPWLVALAALAVLAIVAAWIVMRPAPPSASPTLAVLPFDGADGVLGAGVSEAVQTRLAANPELRVVGGASARLLAAREDLAPAARRLGVGHVLEGSARTADGRLLATARLVRVRDGRAVWSGRYERPAEDVFAVQNEIAAAVAQQLGVRVAPANNRHLVTRPEVYDRYLQARGLARERRTAPLQEARRLLLEAAALDPDYAPAFASLAQVTMLLSNHPTSYGETPIPEAQAEARRYARRALELAPELSEAYAAYGLISLSDAQALPFYRRAAALEPQRADYHRWVAQSLSAVGREAEALEAYRRAAALDPLHWLTIDHLVGQLSFLGRHEEAAATFERYARISNDAHGVARVRMSLARQQGRLADHVRLAEAAVRRWPAERTLAATLAQAWSALGETGRAVAALGPDQTIARLSLSGDAEGLAREARRLGRDFWQHEPGYWGFAEGLAAGGHGALLLELYDAEFESVEDFYGRAPSKALPAGPALIAAMVEAGRRDEADALAALMLRRLDADVSAGLDPAHAGYERAAVLALTGRRDAAVAELARSVRGGWASLAWTPTRLADRLAFRGLRGHSGMAPVQADLTRRINGERAKLGLPPLAD